MLNTKIQRVELSEKTRDVSITCYSKNTILDLESLSGGEQVSIALALRLGMTQLLGSSNLNFIILDEPTMFLDEERRKSLVKFNRFCFGYSSYQPHRFKCSFEESKRKRLFKQVLIN